jgi:hypothetical protein
MTLCRRKLRRITLSMVRIRNVLLNRNVTEHKDTYQNDTHTHTLSLSLTHTHTHTHQREREREYAKQNKMPCSKL